MIIKSLSNRMITITVGKNTKRLLPFGQVTFKSNKVTNYLKILEKRKLISITENIKIEKKGSEEGNGTIY